MAHLGGHDKSIAQLKQKKYTLSNLPTITCEKNLLFNSANELLSKQKKNKNIK